MRRIKTEPSLSLTPKEYMERREKEKALQAMHQVPYIFCKMHEFEQAVFVFQVKYGGHLLLRESVLMKRLWSGE